MTEVEFPLYRRAETMGILDGGSGIDAALWDRLPNLALDQAIVSFTSLARPLLVAIDPTPCKLQMVE